MNRGEIWWTDFDPAVGSEIQKTRPAVIVSNDVSNRQLSRVVVVPLSTKTTRLYHGEALVVAGSKSAKAMPNQITTVDKSRLKSHLGKPLDFRPTRRRSSYKSAPRAVAEHLPISRGDVGGTQAKLLQRLSRPMQSGA